MNDWLQREADANDALHTMLGEANRLFTSWVHALAEGRPNNTNIQSLVALCHQLRDGSSEEAENAGPAEVALVETAPAGMPELPIELPSLELPPVLDASDKAGLLAEPEVEDLAAPTLPVEPVELDIPVLPPVGETTAPIAESLQVFDFPAPAPIEIGSLELSPTLYETYMGEARTHVATMQDEFSAADLPPSPSLIRAAHTLGGISATVGLRRFML